MLKTTSGATSAAGPMAGYLLGQAIKPDPPDRDLLDLGARVHNGEVPYHIALDRLVELETADLRGELREGLEGLRTALAPDTQARPLHSLPPARSNLEHWAREVARDFAEFDDVLEVLVAAEMERDKIGGFLEIEERVGSGLIKAIIAAEREIAIVREIHSDLKDRSLVVDQAASRLAWAIHRAEHPEPDLTPGVRYRRDTDPRLAAVLGIDPAGAPTKAVIANLMRAHDANNHPLPGKYRSSVGYQAFLFTATKDVSVAWALGTAEEKSLALSAHRAAINETMPHIAELIGLVRSGDGGKQTERAHITWIEFDHPTARRTGHSAADPDLHTHLIVPNVTLSATRDKFGSLHTIRLHDAMRPLRMIYEKSLAANLTARGIEATYHQDRKDVTLTAIPTGIAPVFSKRREEAKLSARQYLDKHGIVIDRLPVVEQNRHISRAVVAGTRRERGIKRHDSPTPPNPDSWQRQVRAQGWRLTHVISESFRMAQRLAVQDRLAQKLTHGSGIELEQGHSQFRGRLEEEDDLLRSPSLRL